MYKAAIKLVVVVGDRWESHSSDVSVCEKQQQHVGKERTGGIRQRDRDRKERWGANWGTARDLRGKKRKRRGRLDARG